MGAAAAAAPPPVTLLSRTGSAVSGAASTTSLWLKQKHVQTWMFYIGIPTLLYFLISFLASPDREKEPGTVAGYSIAYALLFAVILFVVFWAASKFGKALTC